MPIQTHKGSSDSVPIMDTTEVVTREAVIGEADTGAVTGEVDIGVEVAKQNPILEWNDVLREEEDLRVDHEMYSFLDGLSGYNQVRMAPGDKEKTTFIFEWGAFASNLMNFGLKNALATF